METHRAGDRVKHCVKDAGNRGTVGKWMWAGRRGGLSAEKAGCIENHGGGLSISRTLDVGAVVYSGHRSRCQGSGQACVFGKTHQLS